jgi:hypothetical protein
MKLIISEHPFPVRIRPGNICLCDIDVYSFEDVDMVVCTEREDNEGMSVTNAIEKIAEAVVVGFALDPERLAWVEHYTNGIRGESWDGAELKFRGNRCTGVDWFPISNLPATRDEVHVMSPESRKRVRELVDELVLDMEKAL